MLSELASPLERRAPSRLPEAMDRPDCDERLLRDALETLARSNRRFGARHLVLSAVLEILAGRRGGPVRILDVGTGSGDIGAHVRRRLAAEGFRARAVLADLNPRVLLLTRRRLAGERRRAVPGAITFVRLTAPALPFPEDAFDVAVSSTMLHHLEDAQAADFLGELDRVASAGWVVTDLRRSRPAYLALRLLAGTLWRGHPVPRRDGPVSVLRAFTASEARRLLDEAGLQGVGVERCFPFRLRLGRGPGAA